MKILCVLESNQPELIELTNQLSRRLVLRSTVQITPYRDASRPQMEWADLVLIGLHYSLITAQPSHHDFFSALPPSLWRNKPIAIFQLQHHADSPLAAAYGCAFARALRQQHARLVASPRVFYCDTNDWRMNERETLRAGIWLNQLLRPKHRPTKPPLKN